MSFFQPNFGKPIGEDRFTRPNLEISFLQTILSVDYAYVGRVFIHTTPSCFSPVPSHCTRPIRKSGKPRQSSTTNLQQSVSAGGLGTVFQLFIVTGILYSYTFGAVVKYVPFCLLCSVWALLHLLGALCIPESPYYLMMKNRPERAAAALQTLRGSSDTAGELADIKVNVSDGASK